jgi:hypothetical protein
MVNWLVIGLFPDRGSDATCQHNQRWESVDLTVRITIFDADVLALDIASFF